MFARDLVKIKYIHEGYLPDIPYKMISDRELCDAFTREDGYFIQTYPCPGDNVSEAYEVLKECVFSNISAFLEDGLELEPWVYAYMLGTATGPLSESTEIEYLNTLLGVNVPVITEFAPETAEAIFDISSSWVNKMDYRYENRIPTVFGEPCVYKALRLADVDVLGG